MRKFIERALEKISKLNASQIHNLIFDLALENERLETVLDSMTDGVMVSDENNNLVLRNKSSERLIPMLLDDSYDHIIWQSIDDPQIALFLKQTLENQDTVADREFVLERNGKGLLLICSVMPLVRDGKIKGNLLHIEDVTEKRGKEARLRRAESLASLTTLAAGVAHEIKNPLGSMGIHLQLIEKEITKEVNTNLEDISEYLGIINEEVDRLNRIIVDFLFAVRPIDIRLEDGDLNNVINELIRLVHFELEEADIELKLNLLNKLPKIKLDEKYMKQALLNIFKNAISAMPEGGVLEITTDQKGEEISLCIIDSGLGIPEDVMGKIFEPYFTTKDFGSGLGLTLVYKIVKEHSGDIVVKSREDEGTSFHLTFPIPQKEKHLIEWEESVNLK
jgi:two-component system, sporulation sensor kinase E